MKLHTKLLLGFGSLWTTLLLATVIVLLLLKQQSMSLEDAFQSNFDSVDFCDQMILSMDASNQLALAAIWTGTAPSKEALDAAKLQFNRGADGQQHNITLSNEGALTTDALTKAADFHACLDKFMAAVPEKRPQLYRDSLLPSYLAARHAVQAVTDLNFTHLRTMKASLQLNLSHARAVQIGFALVGVASAVLSFLVLRKTLLGPLHALTASARQVESGNLNLVVPVQAMDELGELAVAFNAMAARLREYRQLDHARLRRTQQTTQLAIDSLPDAVAVLNAQGQVEISNYQARTHFGLSPEGGPNGQIHTWLWELIAGPLATGRPVEPEGYHSAVQLFDRGSERFLLPRAVPMFSETGVVIGVVVTLVDVTLLRRADEIKSCLVSTVSHELKTPLAAARFSAHLLAQESVGPLDDRQRRLIKATCEGADRLHRIIEDLLQFQRFEEGRQVVRMASVQPEAMIARAVGELRDEFVRHGLQFTLHMSAELPAVSADGDLMNHVVTNLLSNTLKFVPKGGEVRLSVEEKSKVVEFVVADNGPGIPQKHVPRLFSRFYRAAAPAGTSGAGLGLSIARQLVEAQGGKIYFEANPGGGARFVFQLNVAVRTSEVPAPVS